MSGPERTVMFQLPSVLAGTLACVGGTVAGRSWDLSAGTFVIGRNDDCDLALPAEPGVSKVHCKIVAEGEHYLLADCESRNGTIVNGAPIQRVKLRDGDEIRVCGCTLRFSQRGGDSQIRVRNADLAFETEAVERPQTSPALMARPEPPMLLPTDALSAISVPATAAPVARASRGRTLLTWYASGLVGSLLFGGTASAVIFAGGEPPELVEAAGDKPADHPAGDQPAEHPAEEKPAAVPAADVPAADAPAAAVDAAAVQEVAAADQLPPEPPKEGGDGKADENAANQARESDDEVAAAPATPAVREDDPPRRRPRRDEAAASPAADRPAEATVKSFAAAVEGSKSEALKTRGGKVKSVGAADGDTVERGQVLVTFDAGGNEDEVATLRERVASLEGIEDDDARRQLREARQRLDALQAASKAVPVVAGMSGTLTGFTAAVGDVLKSNQLVGRIAATGTPRKVRVTVDRSTRVRRGASATLELRGGGEGAGTVSSVSGRTVVIDTGDHSAAEVERVRF